MKDCNGVLGVADLYCNNGHGYYLAPQILLCVAYGKRLSDFTQDKDPLVYMTNDGGYWSNLSASSYNHYVTGEIEPIEPYDGVLDDFNNSIGKIWSNNLYRYIDQDDDDFVYCSNIEDYEWYDEIQVCNHCGECLSIRGDYVEANDGTIFCSDDCASYKYIYIESEKDWFNIDDVFYCPDCYDNLRIEDGKLGDDFELYCSDCVHDHLDDEEED